MSDQEPEPTAAPDESAPDESGRRSKSRRGTKDKSAAPDRAADNDRPGGGSAEETSDRPVVPAGPEGNLPQPNQPAGPPAVNTRTRIGAAWVAVAVAVVVLVLLLVFILQNQDQVTVTFFTATGQFPLGVLLLFAAAGGALLVIVLGIARIIQLRWLARRDRRASAGQHKQVD